LAAINVEVLTLMARRDTEKKDRKRKPKQESDLDSPPIYYEPTDPDNPFRGDGGKVPKRETE
jgi:hypothetical protein